MGKVICATKGPRHHLFGFHDLIAFNETGEKLLSIESEIINRPPISDEEFGVGYVLWEKQQFIELGKTYAMNYPQGARQQWIDNAHFIVNNKVGDHWGADIYDVAVGKKVKTIDSTCHILSLDKKIAYGINYSRLHRLGGYGYIGLPDKTINEEIPLNDGIFKTCIETNKTELIVSINEVADCDPTTSVRNGFHHYITHLVLSPDGQRIAFLHRFFLPDGGIRHRLMTIGINGENLRCIACGFLSHFDWKDSETIYIWGRLGNSIDSLRANPIMSNPIVAPILGIAKKLVRSVMRRSHSIDMSMLYIKDTDAKYVKPFALGIITADGHPMTCPTDRNYCICDTYPDSNKERCLFTYEFSSGIRRNIGIYRMSDELPDTTLFDQYSQGLDSKILSLFSPDLFSFTRSGLHCDLHPRWDVQGNMVAFDSIHEGSRQIYIYKIK